MLLLLRALRIYQSDAYSHHYYRFVVGVLSVVTPSFPHVAAIVDRSSSVSSAIGGLVRTKRLQRLSKRHNFQTPCPLERRSYWRLTATARRRHPRWTQLIPPLAETAPQIPRDALEHDCRDGYKRPVFHASRENRVLLREIKCVVKRGVLGLSLAPDNDVHLKERVQDVNFACRKVCLAEGTDFDDL